MTKTSPKKSSAAACASEPWTAGRVNEALSQALHLLTEQQVSSEQRNPLAVFDDTAPFTALCAALDLSRTEQLTLLLAAVAEVHPLDFRQFVRTHYDEQAAPPLGCVSRHLALHLLRGDSSLLNPSALSADGPLLRLEVLVRFGAAGGHHPSVAPLHLDATVLDYLYGESRLHPLLARSAQVMETDGAAGMQVDGGQVQLLLNHLNTGPLAAAQLHGPDLSAQTDLARSVCAALDGMAVLLSLDHFAGLGRDLDRELRLWDRESRLRPLAFLLDTAGQGGADEPDRHQRESLAASVAAHLHGPLTLLGREPLDLGQARPALLLEVAGLSRAEQRALWATELELGHSELPGLRELTDQFHLSARLVRERAASARLLLEAQDGPQEGGDTGKLRHAWNACRVAGRQRLGHLAERLNAEPTWEDVVLPPEDKAVLRQITEQVRWRAQVYEDWGMGTGGRGLGISALFSGPSGTGKTLAAEVVAHELRLDLYRVDVASMVSKYIGETEKNLRQIFDAADEGGVILLFDEADSLFGKRGDAQSSNDRFANTQINYLLQRMDTYRGLALLTTNLESGMDSAFMRRLRFTLNFKPPGPAERQTIWQRAFPAQVNVSGLDFARLGQVKLSGGNIRSVALSAAFLAAARGEGISMRVLREAIEAEWRKLGRLSLDDSAFAGWDE